MTEHFLSSSKYCFDIDFELDRNVAIQSKSPQLLISQVKGKKVVLISCDGERALADSRYFSIKGTGWDSQKEALEAGKVYRNALFAVFIKYGFGANFRRYEPYSDNICITDCVTAYSETTIYCKKQVIWGSGVKGIAEQKIQNDLIDLADSKKTFDTEEINSISLFFDSKCQADPCVQFILLIMAVESIVKSKNRSVPAVKHVEQLIDLTRNNTCLDEKDRQSMISSLDWLKKKSIGQATQELIESRLAGKQYNGMAAGKFFRKCYDLRSKMVHGNTVYSCVDEVKRKIRYLAELVSDLILNDKI